MVYFHYFGQSWCKSIISTLPMIWLSFRITKDKCRTKTASTGAGFKIKVDNRKWKITTTSQTPVANVDEPIKVEPFIYPGSMVGTQSGQDRDIKPKIGKASAAFTMLKNIWASSGSDKLQILNSNRKSLYCYMEQREGEQPNTL